MVPIIKQLWYAIRYDEVAIRRWLRGLLVVASATVAQVNAYSWEAAREWDWQSWIAVLLTAGVTGGAAMINLGERNPRGPKP